MVSIIIAVITIIFTSINITIALITYHHRRAPDDLRWVWFLGITIAMNLIAFALIGGLSQLPR